MDVQVDFGVPSQLQGMVETAMAAFGKIDVLVASAVVGQIKDILEITEEDWDRILDVNAKGLFFTNQLVARQMIKQGNGSIVNISSIAGWAGRSNQAHYAASKAAVISIFL